MTEVNNNKKTKHFLESAVLLAYSFPFFGSVLLTYNWRPVNS